MAFEERLFRRIVWFRASQKRVARDNEPKRQKPDIPPPSGTPAVQVAWQATAQPLVIDLKPLVGATGRRPLRFHFDGLVRRGGRFSSKAVYRPLGSPNFISPSLQRKFLLGGVLRRTVGNTGLVAVVVVGEHGFNNVWQNADLVHAGRGGLSQIVQPPRLEVLALGASDVGHCRIKGDLGFGEANDVSATHSEHVTGQVFDSAATA